MSKLIENILIDTALRYLEEGRKQDAVFVFAQLGSLGVFDELVIVEVEDDKRQTDQ